MNHPCSPRPAVSTRLRRRGAGTVSIGGEWRPHRDPGNYGSLPRTKGADGDPLDIIAVGPSIERGSVLPVKVVGVIRCIDDGDQDDKVIALTQGSPLYAKVNTLADLNKEAVNGAEILRTWFDSYKGAKPGSKMDCSKVDDESVAKRLIADA